MPAGVPNVFLFYESDSGSPTGRQDVTIVDLSIKLEGEGVQNETGTYPNSNVVTILGISSQFPSFSKFPIDNEYQPVSRIDATITGTRVEGRAVNEIYNNLLGIAIVGGENWEVPGTPVPGSANLTRIDGYGPWVHIVPRRHRLFNGRVIIEENEIIGNAWLGIAVEQNYAKRDAGLAGPYTFPADSVAPLLIISENLFRKSGVGPRAGLTNEEGRSIVLVNNDGQIDVTDNVLEDSGSIIVRLSRV